MQIVVPKANKAKGDISPHEYEITTFDLGPSTKAQVKEDLDNSVASMKAKLDEETQKKNEHKRDVERLKEYIRQLTTKPLNQANPEVLSLLDSQQAIKSSEEDAETARETRDWIENIKEAAMFIEGISSAYNQTYSLLSTIENMVEMWADFQDVQNRIIPSLRELKGISSQELVDQKIIEAGAAYDFCWLKILYTSTAVQNYGFQPQRVSKYSPNSKGRLPLSKLIKTDGTTVFLLSRKTIFFPLHRKE